MDDDNKSENKENENKAPLPIKESVYDKIPLTLKQLDVIIAVLAVAFIIFFVIGALKGNGFL